MLKSEKVYHTWVSLANFIRKNIDRTTANRYYLARTPISEISV